MVDLFGSLSGTFGIGSLSDKFGLIMAVLMWAFGSIVVAVVIGLIVFLFIKYKQYNQIIKVYGLVGNKPAVKYITRGRFIPMGRAGDRVMILRKPKGRLLPMPTIQMGKNEWWYWEREDGELINFSIDDLDAQFKKAGAYYVHTDMRMERLGIEKNLKERFEKPTWWERYGTQLMSVVFLIILFVMLVVLFYQLSSVAGSLESAMDLANQVLDRIGISESPNPQRPSGENVVPVQTITLPLINSFGGLNVI